MERQSILCGCGNHEVTPGKEPLQIWRDKYWRIDCCMKTALSEADSSKSVGEALRSHNRLKELLRAIARLPCYCCNSEVGSKFEFHGNAIYCKRCFLETTVDIGGEG